MFSARIFVYNTSYIYNRMNVQMLIFVVSKWETPTICLSLNVSRISALFSRKLLTAK